MKYSDFKHALIINLIHDDLEFTIMCNTRDNKGKCTSDIAAKIAWYNENGILSEGEYNYNYKGCPSIEMINGMSDFGAYKYTEKSMKPEKIFTTKITETTKGFYTQDTNGEHELSIISIQEYAEIHLDNTRVTSIDIQPSIKDIHVWEVDVIENNLENNEIPSWKTTGNHLILPDQHPDYRAVLNAFNNIR